LSRKTYKIGGNEDKQEHQTETALMTLHVALAVMKVEINPMWILRDNESTVDIFKKRQTVTNIHTTNNPIRLKGIEGTIHIEEEGDLLGYGTVYFNENVTANILSFYNMAKKFKSLKYDNTKRDAFVVTRDDGSTFEIIPSPDGLYYYDFSNSVKLYKNLLENQHVMVIDTVDDLKRNFTKREIAAADVARRLYIRIGRSSQESFEKIICRGQILNSPVTISDYRNVLTIYGKDLGSIKGKTTRSKPHHVQVESGSPEKLRIVLSVDIMHFTVINFLITVSRNFRFITAGVLTNRKRVAIFNSIKHVMNLYIGKGHDVAKIDFTEYNGPIQTTLADNEFVSSWEDIEEFGVEVNVTAKEEHVPEVERQICVIKKRARAIIQNTAIQESA
jgi:hypothetical protein